MCLQAIIRNYLLCDIDTFYTRIRRRMFCGIPRGSVLGPFLWNLAYDVVLRMVLPRNVEVICNADNTLVLACEPTFEDTKRLAIIGVEMIVTKICDLELDRTRLVQQATEKQEAASLMTVNTAL